MKHVFFFGNGRADGNTQMSDILGGKGANIAEMTIYMCKGKIIRHTTMDDQ